MHRSGDAGQVAAGLNDLRAPSLTGTHATLWLGLPTLLCGASTFSAVSAVALGYWQYRHGYPPAHYNVLGGRPFDDLLEYWPKMALLHTNAFFTASPRVAYPPFAVLLLALLYCGGYPVFVYLTLGGLWLAVCCCGAQRLLKNSGMERVQAWCFTLLMLGASFPLAGLLQRGNIELLVWILATTGIAAYLCRHSRTAAILWGLAAAVKLYPILFLGLPLLRRQLRLLALGVAAFLVVSAASAWWLGPTLGIALWGSLQNIFGYQGTRVSDWTLHELAINHSAFGWVKVAATVCDIAAARLTWMYIVAAMLLAAFALYRRRRQMPLLNQVLAVTVLSVTLVPVSYFYTLVHLYTPWTMLMCLTLQTQRRERSIRGLKTTLLCFVPLFASPMLVTFPRWGLFGGLLQASFLGFLFLCSLEYPFALREVEAIAAEARPSGIHSTSTAVPCLIGDPPGSDE